ncbi:MAG: methyltransferase domain-containing protein [Neisseriaceae bacterium]|nr:methyltransferase domain-containing protein [Neisseriaceae bacterium]MBR3425111.1 methyltransferase domain-containing protein [Neisseriaceae bacterium]
MINQAFNEWLHNSAAGLALYAAEERFFATESRDIFGQTAIQLGGAWQAVENAQVSRKIILSQTPETNTHIVCDWQQLPLSSESVDAVILPHSLNFHAHPHGVLREVYRVLRGEGRLIITGFNPLSLWYFSPKCGKILPPRQRFIQLARLKDWLALLGFELNTGRFMQYTPPISDSNLLKFLNFINLVGDRWLPSCAAVYGISAIKRHYNARPIRQPEKKFAPVGNVGFATANIPEKTAYNAES